MPEYYNLLYFDQTRKTIGYSAYDKYIPKSKLNPSFCSMKLFIIWNKFLIEKSTFYVSLSFSNHYESTFSVKSNQYEEKSKYWMVQDACLHVF